MTVVSIKKLDIVQISNSPGWWLEKKFSMNTKWKGRSKSAFLLAKFFFLLTCLYIFIISLELMSSGFRLLGGRFITQTNKINKVLENKIAGLVVGILITVLVQSSSTSTSIVVSMVSAQIIKVKEAIPIIMGANIGTSITSTIVSFSQMTNSECFERAFAGAIVHDIFNFLSVSILLPIEYAFSYLERVTGLLVSPLLKYSASGGPKIELLSAITKPLTKLIIQLDESFIDKLASGQLGVNETGSMIKSNCSCVFLFHSAQLPEWVIGLIIVIASLVILCVSLVVLVKLLNSIFLGRMAEFIKKFINADLASPFSCFTGYIFILVGAALTVVIQSSSVFTSTLTPLVGIGMVTIERVFPLIIGSNIGTTITGILAALSSPSKTINYALQIALCHTLFNFSGILVWYPIPFMRKVPLSIAKKIGRISGKYKWFSVFYVVVVFMCIPLFLLGLSFAGTIAFVSVFGTLVFLITLVIFINILQHKKSSFLPKKLQNWDFLPKFLHSIVFYDNLIRRYCFFCLKSKPNAEKYQIQPIGDHIAEKMLNENSMLYSSNIYNLEKLITNKYILEPIKPER